MWLFYYYEKLQKLNIMSCLSGENLGCSLSQIELNWSSAITDLKGKIVILGIDWNTNYMELARAFSNSYS